MSKPTFLDYLAPMPTKLTPEEKAMLDRIRKRFASGSVKPVVPARLLAIAARERELKLHKESGDDASLDHCVERLEELLAMSDEEYNALPEGKR